MISNFVCACLLQSADKEAKVNELLHEIEQLKQEHARDVESVKQGYAQELKEVHREQEEKVAQLEAHLALLERKLGGLQTHMQKLQAAHVSLHAVMLIEAAAGCAMHA